VTHRLNTAAPAPTTTTAPPTSSLRSHRLRDLLVALSVANLSFVAAWFGPLYDNDFGYFNRLRVTPLTLLCLVINLLWSAGLVWTLLQVKERTPRRWLRWACNLAFLAFFLVPLDFIRSKFLNITDSQLVLFFSHPLRLGALLLLLAAVVWQQRRAARAATVLASILSPLALFTLFRILSLSLGIQHITQHAATPILPPPSIVPDNAPRVVWIIFDESDQRAVFEQRRAGCRLPAFDRLRDESIYATNAISPADTTFVSMLSLLTGQQFASAVVAGPSDVSVTLKGSGESRSWRSLPTVFKSSRELGLNTALVGWYHPYDRLLADSLNHCTWYPFPGFEVARGSTFARTMERQLGSLSGTIYGRHRFASICQASLAASISVVTNRIYGLTLLHLPPPHRPGIYQPDRNQYTLLGMPKVPGYFNNLMLADQFLGQLRRAMESASLWDQTWVLVSADHSWRESKLYDGQRDYRVPFLLKPAQSGQGSVYAPKLNTVLTHDLILAILRREITNQTAAVAWLDRHRAEAATTLSNHSD